MWKHVKCEEQDIFHDMYWPCYNVWPCCRGKDTECAKYDRLVVRLWRGILGPQLVAQPRPLLVSAAPPPATNTLGHQTSRRCNQGISSIFYLAYLWTIFHTHTHNLKADINAVMVFVCVVIFPTVVRQLIWSCYRPGMKEPSKSGFNERSLPSHQLAAVSPAPPLTRLTAWLGLLEANLQALFDKMERTITSAEKHRTILSSYNSMKAQVQVGTFFLGKA